MSDPTHNSDAWQSLVAEYRAVRAPLGVDQRVSELLAEHTDAGAKRARRRPLLALAASVLCAAVVALWLTPKQANVTTAEHTPPPRVSTAIPAALTLGDARQALKGGASRTPRYPALGSPPRLTRPKTTKEI